MKNMQLKLLIMVLVMFSYTFFFSIGKTKAIYREVKSTTINLTVASNAAHTVTFNSAGGSSVAARTVEPNDPVGVLPIPTKTGNNFAGWYDGNGQRVIHTTPITSDVTLTAHWTEIICKRVTDNNNLHKETCIGPNGCRTSNTFASNAEITYGQVGDGVPEAGDAYDCDVDYDGTFDAKESDDKTFKERFYFVRSKTNSGSEDSAVMYYSTSFDSTGRNDRTHSKTDIDSRDYNTAITYLPQSTNPSNPALAWDNPGLLDVDGNGSVTRFLSDADMESVCGTLVFTSTAYFTSCNQWFWFENTRFQSNNLGRAGIWMEYNGGEHYHRIQTQSLNLGEVADTSEDTARPVIEIPMSALEGYYDEDRFTISYNTYVNDPNPVDSVLKYRGETLGPLPVLPARAHYTFDNWYTDSNYQNVANPNALVSGNTTLYANWTPIPTVTVTLYLNGGTITGVTSPITIDSGDLLDNLPDPTQTGYAFEGWYLDSGFNTQFDDSQPITTNISLYANWTIIPTVTVTLYLDNGTISGVTSPMTINSGTVLDNLPDPIKSGYVFEGWYLDSEFNTSFDETQPITTNTDLYAKWVEYVAEVNGTQYSTLAAAIAAVPTGSTKTRVTLLKDITLSEAVTIPNNKWVELAGGSYTISGSTSLITNSGKLDIISGTINVSSTETANTIITNASGATLNISGGNLINDCYVANATTEFIVIANSGGTVNITGGSISSRGQSSAINNNSGTLNVSGGEIVAHNTTKGQGIYLSGGTVNISGNAYIENTSGTGDPRAAVDNNGGKLYITGGTIVSKGYSAVISRKSGNNVSTTIGTSDNNVDTTNPVLRGVRYGLEVTNNSTVYVYDGLFESLNNTRAVSGPIANNPSFIDSTIDVSGVTYHSTYLAPPTVTVTFDANGGTVEGVSTYDVSVDYGDQIGANMPNDPIRANYYFDGWYDNTTPVTSSTTVTSTMTVYAKWVQDYTNGTITPSSLTMSIEVGDTDNIVISGTDLEEVSYSSDDSTVASVTSSGVVTGVNVGTATITITGSKSNVQRTVTVTVTPIMHTVNFYEHSGDSPVAIESVTDGGTVGANMPPNPTATNYVFIEWTYDDGNGTTTFDSSTPIDDDTDVLAAWKEKVTYATLVTSSTPFVINNGGTGQIILNPTDSGGVVESCTYSSDDTSVATVNASGQVTGEGLGTATITITGSLSNLSRTIQVEVVTLVHQVNFYDSDGVTPLYQSVSVNDGGTVGANMPSNPERQGYVFGGWIYDDGNSLTPFTSATEVYGTIDAIAVWKEPVNSVTYDSSLTVRLGGSLQVTLPPTGTEAVENYTLESSNTNIVEVNNHTIYGTSVGTITLTVRGSLSGTTKTITVNVIDGYSVIFKNDDDTVLETIYVTTGDSIDETQGATLPNNPTKSGYTFDDWYIYDGSAVTTTRLDTSAVVTSDLIYKPRWAGANDVAAIGTTYYTTVQLAIDAVTNSTPTEIRLLKDHAIASGRTTIDSKKDITINANGYILSCSNGVTSNLLYVDGATLRVKNGTFTCNKSGCATLETSSKLTPSSIIYIEDGTTVTNTGNRGAIYNKGIVYVLGGNISSTAEIRSTIANDGTGARVEMSGGSVLQDIASHSDKGAGAIKVEKGTVIITGGTVTSNSTTSAAIDKTGGGTLTIGTDDNDDSYDATTPVIQGNQYGINATSNYSVYDGIIKGKTAAVNSESRITGTEAGHRKVNGTDNGYYTLYYELTNPVQKYHIDFNGKGGTVSDASLEYNLNEQITAGDLATATKGIYTFDGWYTDDDCTIPFTAFTPTQGDTVTYYAGWSYASSSTPVNHIITSDAMTYYFNNVSTWASADAQIAVNQDNDLSNDNHTTYLTDMRSNFTGYSCSECEGNTSNSIDPTQNKCDSPTTGTYCDQPKGYDTGVGADLNVYLTSNGTKTGNPLTYIKSTGGVIYNMIPGVTYYWELQSDANVYGVVTATKNSTHYRRTLKTSIRNLRDLGGMSVSYTEHGVTTNGTIDYGKLYRGAQNASGSTGITELQALGITREVDLRATGDGNTSQTKFPTANYDVSNSDILYTRFYNSQNDKNLIDGYKDVKITNYQINPTVTPYFGNNTYADNFQDLKQAMKAIMRQVVNHEVVFFHCTIGTDRTGTIAYFLEGLLGASNEDRLRDYEMTYFFGLTNRSRFHNNLSSSNINPRFYAMYKSYPNVSDIEDLYFNNYPESDDETLLHDFRVEMIH